MFEESRASSLENLSLTDRHQMLDWITNGGPQKAPTEKEAKQKSWTKVNFYYRDRKLWRNPDKHHSEIWEVLTEPEIFDAIVTIHNSIGQLGQDAKAENVIQIYYCVTHEEIIFHIKLCEICHQKVPSKSKGRLKPIISANLSIHHSRRFSFGPRFSPSGRKSWTFRFWILLHFWTNWGTSRMESSKAPRARDSRLRQVTARDRGARRPPGKEERSPR